jgi:hypothetical protein
VSANFVCARCGNFMCVGCSVNGTEKLCPTCRELTPIGFPYDANADLGTLWAHTTAGFQREMAMLVVACLVFFAFTMGGAIVAQIINTIVNVILGLGANPDPSKLLGNWKALGASFAISQVIGTLVNIATQGVALVGFYRVMMDVLVGKKADLSRMFSQLHLLPQYIGMQLIMFAAIWLPLVILLGIGFGLFVGVTGSSVSQLSEFKPDKAVIISMMGFLLIAMVLLIAAVIVLLPVTMFSVPELIVGQCGPVEALKRAWDLGSGQRARTFGYSFVSGLVMIAGMFACGVGLIFAMPVAFMLNLSLFLALRRSSPLPAAIH